MLSVKRLFLEHKKIRLPRSARVSTAALKSNAVGLYRSRPVKISYHHRAVARPTVAEAHRSTFPNDSEWSSGSALRLRLRVDPLQIVDVARASLGSSTIIRLSLLPRSALEVSCMRGDRTSC